MTASCETYDSRAWTGELPDYKGMIRRAFKLDCEVRPHLVVALYFNAAVTELERQAIVEMCGEHQPKEQQP
jgi:hypothetical protein